MKKLIIVAALAALTTASYAQSGTNSPYSMYGLGVLAEQTSGFNRGMDGLAYGFHERNQINYLNPASYSALDSLSFIFDAGISLHKTNYAEGGHRVNAKEATFEYVVGAFRVAPKLGVSFGLIPFANVGYDFSNTNNVNAFPSTSTTNVTYTNKYSGSGGFRQVYVGAGWEPVKGLAIGFNASYFWGNYTRSVVNSYSDKYVNTLSKTYTANVTSYKLDFGLQYTANLSKSDAVTLGLTYGIGHSLKANPECIVTSTNTQVATKGSKSDTLTVMDGLSIPHTFGAGLMWNHKNQLKLGFDFQMQKWGKLEAPDYFYQDGEAVYGMRSGLYTDRRKMTFGGDYCPGERSHSFFKRMHYRAGVSIASPYFKVNGVDGPKELSVSAGVGIPIINGYNNRSMLNISAQWMKRSRDGLVRENSFRINIGFTFNERWFAKFKVD
jgi:hypothetical protein